MRAYLEFEAPDSCESCRFAYWNESNSYVCFETGKDVEEFVNGRAPFCGLKIIPEGYELMVVLIDLDVLVKRNFSKNKL